MSNNHVIDERKGALNKAALLIADMALNGATQEELERAISYSASIVRAGRHNDDWKQSYEDYVIADLEDKYQETDIDEWNKDYLVIDENYRSPHGDVCKGAMIAGFDTLEEAESLVKEMDSPGLVILGPKGKGGTK